MSQRVAFITGITGHGRLVPGGTAARQGVRRPRTHPPKQQLQHRPHRSSVPGPPRQQPTPDAALRRPHRRHGPARNPEPGPAPGGLQPGRTEPRAPSASISRSTPCRWTHWARSTCSKPCVISRKPPATPCGSTRPAAARCTARSPRRRRPKAHPSIPAVRTPARRCIPSGRP